MVDRITKVNQFQCLWNEEVLPAKKIIHLFQEVVQEEMMEDLQIVNRLHLVIQMHHQSALKPT